ncbi:MAG: cytochrome P450 [Microthrixaceae bacterium]
MSGPADLDLAEPGVLLRPDVLDDPRDFHDALRADAPIWQVPGQDTFLVSDPRLIREAVARTDDFSSNLVAVLHDDGTGCPVAFRLSRPGDPVHVLSTADPPIHTRHRRLLQHHLAPAAVAELEPEIGRIVDDCLDHLLASPAADAVPVFTDAVPIRTISLVLGLPVADADRLVRLVRETGTLLDGTADLDGLGAGAVAALELTGYVEEQLQASLASEIGDRRGLMAVLADAVESGELNVGEARDILVVLVSAGSETTSSLLATAVETLAVDAGLQAGLRRDPSGIPDAIEVMLRTDGPFQFHYRYVTGDTELGGMAIPARSRLLLMWAAANRPVPGAEAIVDAADGRGAAPHFAFGRGLHFCIGAPLARLEARVALERLLARTESIDLDPDRPPTRRPSIFIRRHETLSIRTQRSTRPV